jgi:hypothetical protein
MGRRWGWAMLGVGLWVAGCGSRDGTPTDGLASATPAATFDAPGYCARVCTRATSCSVEKAGAIARGGSAADRAVLDEVTQAREEAQRSCVDACNARPPGVRDGDEARRAQACLDQPDCEALETCLMKL